MRAGDEEDGEEVAVAAGDLVVRARPGVVGVRGAASLSEQAS